MHEVLLTDEARKNIQKLSKPLQVKIRHAIDQVAVDPSIGKALTRELKGRWSCPVSDYRIIYRIEQRQVIVLILAVGHGKDIYKRQARKIN